MELSVKVGQAELINYFLQLPQEEWAKFKEKVDEAMQTKTERMTPKTAKKELTPLQEALLEVPVMSDEQYREYLNDKQYDEMRVE